MGVRDGGGKGGRGGRLYDGRMDRDASHSPLGETVAARSADG